MKKMLFSLLSSAFLALTAQEYHLFRFAKAPVIDGKITERSWNAMPEGRGFYKIFRGIRYARNRLTTFRMGYDNENLYICAFCQEPTPEKMKVLYSYRDGFVCDDSIELFLLPKGKKNFLQIVMNAKGAHVARWEGERKDAPLSDQIRCEAVIGKDHWILEGKIPLKVLEIKATELDQMKFNVARNAIPDKEEMFVSYGRVVGKFGDKANFASLRLRQENGTASFEDLSSAINVRFDRSIHWNLHVIARKGDTYKKELVRLIDKGEIAQLNAIQQKIANTYRSMAKSKKAALLQEWYSVLRNFALPKRKFTLNVDRKGITEFKLCVNGKEVSGKNGVYTVALTEGANVITLSGNAGKAQPFRIRIPEFTEAQTAWKMTQDPPAKYKELSFDDRKWKPFDGKLPAGKFVLRQTILWNQYFYGNLRCFNPPVKEWLFSRGESDVLYFQLYSPVKRNLSRFELLLDLPPELTFNPEKTRTIHRINYPWEKVSLQKIRRNGKEWTRYTIRYADHIFDSWRTAESLLPILCNKNVKEGTKGKIVYQRRIDGNVLEIPGEIPFRVIPPTNGKQLKNAVLSFYMGHMQKLSPSATEKMLQDTFKSGYNTFFCGYKKTAYRDRVVAMGGNVTCGFLFHPYFGPKLKNGAVFKLMDQNKELYATFFDNSREARWDPKKHTQFNKQFFCHTLATTKYAKEFARAVREDYVNIIFKDYPNQKYTFINWEYNPWAELQNKAEHNQPAHCFCTHCKENFRKWAKLPAAEKLDNQTIFRKYYAPWQKFRYELDAKAHKLFADAIRSVGKEIIFYSNTSQKGYWDAAKDVKHTLFLGCPGNPTADRVWQRHLDDTMAYFRNNTIHRKIIGQRFIFMPSTYSWSVNRPVGYLKCIVLSNDGFIHAPSWKTQLIRVMASLHGGLDLQNPLEMVAGVRHYVGEATRLIGTYEDLFVKGIRKDSLASSKEIAYPDLLVLTLGNERLLLAFNEFPTPKKVTILNKGLAKGAKGKSFYDGKTFADPSRITVTIPGWDVVAIHIK